MCHMLHEDRGEEKDVFMCPCIHSFVYCVRCRKEMCVHVERAGWCVGIGDQKKHRGTAGCFRIL